MGERGRKEDCKVLLFFQTCAAIRARWNDYHVRKDVTHLRREREKDCILVARCLSCFQSASKIIRSEEIHPLAESLASWRICFSSERIHRRPKTREQCSSSTGKNLRFLSRKLESTFCRERSLPILSFQTRYLGLRDAPPPPRGKLHGKSTAHASYRFSVNALPSGGGAFRNAVWEVKCAAEIYRVPLLR